MTQGTPELSRVARILLDRQGLGPVADKVLSGERLTLDEGVQLLKSNDLVAIGALANWVRERLHGDLTYFNRNVHINATNVCEATCIFCSFSRLKTGDPAAYTMTLEQAVGRVRALRDVLITEVHIVNGLNPDLPFSYYTDLLQAIKEERPDLHIKGFTAVEIHYYAQKYGMTHEQVLVALREATHAGGAEIFADRARRVVPRQGGQRRLVQSIASRTSSACARTVPCCLVPSSGSMNGLIT